MNPTLEKQMEAADAAMDAHGETQPKEADGRAVTSPANGAKGGRPPVDYGAVAEEFQQNSGIVRWWKGEFYQYDAGRGTYLRLTEREMGARVAGFLKSGGGGLAYSLNAERNTTGVLRATFDPNLAPPCFTDTGQSAAGWIALKNGLLDVEAAARGEPGALQSHTPSFFATYALPYEWNPAAPCPRFMRFLEEVLPDEENRVMARMLAGLLLVPDTSYTVFFILLGDGGCGKSTFLRILGAMLGEENVCSVPLSMIAEKHTSHRLTRCLANLVDDSATVDTTRGQSLAGVEGVLKEVASGARIHCEPKGIDPWDAPAKARCVFTQNPPLPPFVDRSSGIWRRVRVIHFPNCFDGTAGQIPKLAEEIIAEELPGVFAWAVGGLGALRKLKQFPQSAEGAAIIAEHRATCDREKTFLEDRYAYSPGAFTPSGDIYHAYRTWCTEEGYNAKGGGNFAQEVRRVFPRVEHLKKRWMGKQGWGFWNLAAVTEEEEEA